MPTAVITGSTRGIGLGLARELHKRGCAVVVTGRSQEAADAAAHELGRADVLAVACDVADQQSLQHLWEVATDRFGRIDIWINNAGATTSPIPFWQLPIDQIQQVISTNVLGTAYGTLVALRGMQSQGTGGHIFNVEGMGSKGKASKREVQPGVITYGTSKAYVGYLNRSLHKELKGSKVALSTIRPGINVTEHLLHDVHVLPAEQWEKSRKVLNILGDRPETTTPWIAERILAAQRPTRIAWLSGRRIAWRFLTASLHKRDLFADIEPSRLPIS